MLLSLRVANHRAMRDPQELTFRRAQRLRSGRADTTWDRAVSPVAVVYGGNASGKSTVVGALRYIATAVRDSFVRWRPDGGTYAVPFALDEAHPSEPSEFEVDFRVDGVDYQYGFQVSPREVEAEWLYAYRTAHRTVLYERGLDETRVIHFGNTFRGDRRALRDAAQNRPNALTLSVAAQLGNAMLHPIFAWFDRDLMVVDASGYTNGLPHLTRRLRDDAAQRDRLSLLLARADLGVCGIDVVKQPMSLEQREEFARIVRAVNPGIDEAAVAEMVEEQSHQLQLKHSTAAGSTPLPFEWESAGTHALLSFAPLLQRALDDGAVLVVDEVDTSLHPLLVRELVRVFLDDRVNRHQAQLLFTTHDASLLGRSTGDDDLLDRDQIWVTEKDVTGATTLVSIGEYRTPRKAENLERGYLTGRYGGVPNVNLLDALRASDTSMATTS